MLNEDSGSDSLLRQVKIAWKCGFAGKAVWGIGREREEIQHEKEEKDG